MKLQLVILFFLALFFCDQVSAQGFRFRRANGNGNGNANGSGDGTGSGNGKLYKKYHGK